MAGFVAFCSSVATKQQKPADPAMVAPLLFICCYYEPIPACIQRPKPINLLPHQSRHNPKHTLHLYLIHNLTSCLCSSCCFLLGSCWPRSSSSIFLARVVAAACISSASAAAAVNLSRSASSSAARASSCCRSWSIRFIWLCGPSKQAPQASSVPASQRVSA